MPGDEERELVVILTFASGPFVNDLLLEGRELPPLRREDPDPGGPYEAFALFSPVGAGGGFAVPSFAASTEMPSAP